MKLLSSFLLLVIFGTQAILAQQFDICSNTSEVSGIAGSITSPNYPEEFGSHNCSISINVPSDQAVQVQFSAFKIIDGCSFDYVEIYVGGDLYMDRQFCAETSPDDFVTNDDVTFVFVSDASVFSTGFKIDWAFVTRLSTVAFTEFTGFETTPAALTLDICGSVRDLSGSEGVITSPGYPGIYPGNHDCEVNIYTPEGQSVELSFESFALENTCDFDRVEIFIGGVLKATLCGSELPEPVVTGENVTVRFIADRSISFVGFKINWKFYEGYNGTAGTTASYGTMTVPTTEAHMVVDICDLLASEMFSYKDAGSLVSPGYPGDYPSNIYCSVIVKARENQLLRVKFESFSLENGTGDECPFDRVNIFIGEEGAEGNSNTSYCGDNVPADIETAETVIIRFRSDGSQNFAGFKFDWEFVVNDVPTFQEVLLSIFSSVNPFAQLISFWYQAAQFFS